MLNQFLSLFFMLFVLDCLTGQNNIPNYEEDIKPILSKHCISCHYDGGPGPFSLELYEEAAKRSKFIAYVTGKGYMPPWKANPHFQSYRNERLLSDDEKEKLKLWAIHKAPQGDLTMKNKNKNRKSKQFFRPEVKLSMNAPFEIPANNRDDFRFFHLPLRSKKETYITGIEFIAGNKARVHHSRIMVDTTGHLAGINGMSETDPELYKFQKYPLADEFLYGWVPGNFVFRFPKGFGRKLYRGSDIILNMHYSPSSLNEKDQSGVNLFIAEEKDIKREVKTMILRENDITNKPFYITAGTKPTFYLTSAILEEDISLLTVQPHAHLLGKYFRAFAITKEGDLIPLIQIDNWDFDWQTTYEFNTLLRIPAGSIIIMEGQYDNTADNPVNPNKPPRDVTYGWRTVDEMMNLIMYYVDYKEGDETMPLVYPDN